MSEGNGNGATVTLPGGAGGSVKGREAIFAAVVLALAAGAGYVGLRAIEASNANAKAIETTIKDVGEENGRQHRAIERSFYLLSCVLQYPPEQRAPMRTASSLEAFVQFCPWLPTSDLARNGLR